MQQPTHIGLPNPPPPLTTEKESGQPRTNYDAPAGAIAAIYAAKRYGGPTRIRESRPSIGITPSNALGNNPKRIFWLICNTSINSMSYGQDNSVTVANGLPLSPSGGGISMAVDEDAEAVTYPVVMIASVAASSMYVIEVERV